MSNQTEILKNILENSLLPQRLDSHPWSRSLLVRQACSDTPDLLKSRPGQRLVVSLARLFTQMKPSTPPRKGKRLDTRWGEFGMLAAEYFVPILFGKPAPETLREAWGYIDQSILLFVYGKSPELLSEEEKAPYRLVGNEMEVAPNSTLSDWHRNGLDRLMGAILRRESYLSGSLSKPAVITHIGQRTDNVNSRFKKNLVVFWRYFFSILGIALLGGLIFGSIKAYKIYNQVLLVRQDAVNLRSIFSGSGTKLEQIRAAEPSLSTLSQDFTKLKNDSAPYLWLGPWLSWVPVYGGDLSSAQDLIPMVDSLLASAKLTYQAAAPLINGDGPSGITPSQLTEALVQSQSLLIQAKQKISEASSARSRIETERLSPEIRDLIINDIDPILPLMQDGLTVAEELPRLMGASTEGPKTYLLLVENEDELRPTGGLVTAVGKLLLQNGQISAPTFENEDQTINPLVDWSKPYPAAPWQLQQYMNSRVLLVRDTSWFTNFPTAALYADTLYSYVSNSSVDGVIAFDQEFLVDFLKTTGPIQVEGVSYPINSSNVIEFMRSAKTPTAADLASPDWNNKLFIKLISDALLEKLTSGAIPLIDLTMVLLQDLNEHHLLLQVDSPVLTTVLANHRWDGAIHPAQGDFLMAVDTNVGFNKTNAVVSENMIYDVDLTNASSPTSTLTITHKNNAVGMICRQWDKIRLPEEENYPINDCYWNYLRVYTSAGAKLLDAAPQFVPANWMLVKQDVPARVDTLDEGIKGVQTFGTLQVVPGGESLATSFSFSLPSTIIQTISGKSTYHLFVQKQPGTLANPLTIRIHLPNNSTVVSSQNGAVVQDNNILYQINLQTDVDFTVVYTFP